MVRIFLEDKHQTEPVKCSQTDKVVRTGVVGIEEEVTMLEKAGYNFKDWLEKNYGEEKVKQLSTERELQINDLDYKEELDKEDHIRDIKKQLKENKKEFEEIKSENENIEKQLKQLESENKENVKEIIKE